MPETVADGIADELARAGVDRAFGLPGGEVLHLLEAMRQRGIEFTLCHHEAAAGIAAAVYGKLRGTAGVAISTLGPGATNLLFPLANSLLDREPLVAISADLPRSAPAGHTHQRLPLLAALGPVCKFAAAVEPGGHRQLVRAAISAAVSEPMGPAYLTLSADDARAEGASESALADPATRSLGGGAGEAAAELRRRLAAAERPLVLVGLGTKWEDSALLKSWLERWRLPNGVTPKAKGMVDELNPTFVGVFGGMAIDRTMLEALDAADLVVGFGLDPVEIDKTWHAERDITWILESSCATGVVPEGTLLAEHSALLEALGVDLPPRDWRGVFDSVRTARREIYEAGRGRLTPTGIVAAASAGAPPETLVTTDVGSHKFLFGQFWPSRQPGCFWMSNGLSGMGYGIPAAIGAKLARPDRPVLAVIGDGGFAMTAQELETARRAGAAIVVVVIVDGSLSLIRLAQEARGLRNLGVDFTPIDSILAARAAGVDGVRAETPEAVTKAVSSALAGGKPFVIEVPLDPDSYRGIV